MYKVQLKIPIRTKPWYSTYLTMIFKVCAKAQNHNNHFQLLGFLMGISYGNFLWGFLMGISYGAFLWLFFIYGSSQKRRHLAVFCIIFHWQRGPQRKKDDNFISKNPSLVVFCIDCTAKPCYVKKWESSLYSYRGT